MLWRIFIVVFVLAVTSSFASESIHSYTDENGQTIYYSTNDKKASQPLSKRQHQSDLKKDVRSDKPIVFQPNIAKPLNNLSIQTVKSRSYLDAIIAPLMEELLITMVIGSILALFWLIALLDILKNEFTGSNKIIWIVLLIMLPPLGTILYFIIGKGQKVIYQEESSNDGGSTLRSYRKPDL